MFVVKMWINKLFQQNEKKKTEIISIEKDILRVDKNLYLERTDTREIENELKELLKENEKLKRTVENDSWGLGYGVWGLSFGV